MYDSENGVLKYDETDPSVTIGFGKIAFLSRFIISIFDLKPKERCRNFGNIECYEDGRGNNDIALCKVKYKCE